MGWTVVLLRSYFEFGRGIPARMPGIPGGTAAERRARRARDLRVALRPDNDSFHLTVSSGDETTGNDRSAL